MSVQPPWEAGPGTSSVPTTQDQDMAVMLDAIAGELARIADALEALVETEP